MISVKTKNILDNLKNHDEGELALVEDTHTFYVYKEDNWIEQTVPQASISLYELNKQFYAKKDKIDPADSFNLFKEFTSNGKYFMLLNNENHYYTIFHKNGNNKLPPIEGEIIDIISGLGPVKSIEKNDSSIEIWTEFNDEMAMFMLFNYDEGALECA